MNVIYCQNAYNGVLCVYNCVYVCRYECIRYNHSSDALLQSLQFVAPTSLLQHFYYLLAWQVANNNNKIKKQQQTNKEMNKQRTIWHNNQALPEHPSKHILHNCP